MLPMLPMRRMRPEDEEERQAEKLKRRVKIDFAA